MKDEKSSNWRLWSWLQLVSLAFQIQARVCVEGLCDRWSIYRLNTAIRILDLFGLLGFVSSFSQRILHQTRGLDIKIGQLDLGTQENINNRSAATEIHS